MIDDNHYLQGIQFDRALLPGLRAPLSPGQLWRILLARRCWIANITALFVVAAVAAAVFVPDKYIGSVSLVIDIPASDPTGQRNVPSMLAENYWATQIDLLKSDPVLLRVVEQQNLAEDAEAHAAFSASAHPGASFKHWLAGLLGESVTVASGTTSRMIRVQVSDTSPQRAAELANAVVRAYRHVSARIAAEPALERLQSYNGYLDELRGRVDAVQQRLTSAQQRSGVIRLDRSGVADTQRLEDLGIRLNQAESDRQTAEAEVQRIEELRRQGRPVTAQADILGSSFVQQLKSRLIELRAQQAELAGTLGANNPRMQSLSAQIATVSSRLSQEIDAYIKANRGQAATAASREAALRSALQREHGDVLTQQKKRDEIASLVRELDSAEQVYKAALAQYDSVLGGSEMEPYNVSVVSWATPPRWASGMTGKTILLLGLLFGVLVGCALALAVELLGRRVRHTDDVTRELGLPVLGELPA